MSMFQNNASLDYIEYLKIQLHIKLENRAWTSFSNPLFFLSSSVQTILDCFASRRILFSPQLSHWLRRLAHFRGTDTGRPARPRPPLCVSNVNGAFLAVFPQVHYYFRNVVIFPPSVLTSLVVIPILADFCLSLFHSGHHLRKHEWLQVPAGQ